MAHRGTGRLTGGVVLVTGYLGGVGSWVGSCLGSWVALGGCLWVGGVSGSGGLGSAVWVALVGSWWVVWWHWVGVGLVVVWVGTLGRGRRD